MHPYVENLPEQNLTNLSMEKWILNDNDDDDIRKSRIKLVFKFKFSDTKFKLHIGYKFIVISLTIFGVYKLIQMIINWFIVVQ